MNRKKLLKYYRKYGFKLTSIPKGKKFPVHDNWNTEPTTYKQLENGLSDSNIGLVHSLSGYVCFDIDDVEECDKLPELKALLKTGLQYTSGKENRIKVLFRIPKNVDSKYFVTKSLRVKQKSKVFGQVRCCSSANKSLQDVLPPSTLDDGRQYTWISDLPQKKSGIPKLPKSIVKEFKKYYKMLDLSNGLGKRYTSNKISQYVKVYNDWFTEKYNIGDEILKTGGYEESPCGKGYNRVGSESGSVNVHILEDEFGEFGYNFSDATPDTGKQIPYGAFDPYTLLVINRFNGDEKAARKWVCTHNSMKKLVDDAHDVHEENNVPKLRMDGILFDYAKQRRPYLDMDLMVPKKNGKETMFGKLVMSILKHQQGVYNPDMAFWYSIVLGDYLIGGGYGSIGGNSCEPIYVFTAGDSSDGKTVTMNSGSEHLLQIGARGNSMAGDIIVDDTAKEATPVFSTAFANKKHLKNVKTAEGLEDLITVEMDHGCDVLFTQDEYGLKENGTMDNAARNFRATILDYKTLSRSGHVEPRLLAKKSSTQHGPSQKGQDTYCVHFNYFTTATDTTLKGVIRDEEVGQGYIQRFIGGASRSPHFQSRVDVYGKRSWHKSSIPKDLKKRLAEIVTISNKNTGFSRTKSYTEVNITNEASEYLDELHRVCILSNDPMTAKMIENLQPIAKLYAIFDNPKRPLVDIDMVKWAHSICTSSILYFRYLLDKLRDVGKPPAILVQELIIKYFTDRNITDPTTAVTRATVIRRANLYTRSISVKEYGPVWDALITTGILGCVSVEMVSGQISDRYYLR